MFNLVGEVLQCAKRNRFLWGINNISVALGVVRDDDLGMAFCPKGSTFEQRFFVPYALMIDILSGAHIVNSVNHKVQSSPEIIIEVVFGVFAYFQLGRLEI